MTAAERLKAEERAEGLEKGKAEGKAEGQAQLLLRQLTLRFGPLQPAVALRIRSASTDDRELMAERILSARNVEEALG